MDSGSAALHGTERTAAAPQPRGAPKDSETVVRGGESALAHGEAAGEAGPLPAHPALTGATLLGCHSMKAGLPSAHIDRERIARIVEEASRGSKFYQFKVRKEAKIDERIAALRERRARLLEADSNIFSKTKVGVDRTILRALSMRRLDRVYVHIDMDGTCRCRLPLQDAMSVRESSSNSCAICTHTHPSLFCCRRDEEAP